MGIHSAAAKGNLTEVKCLLEEHPALLCEELNGRIPLFFAANNGHLDVVRYFVDEKKVYYWERASFGPTAVHEAVRNGQLEVLRYFLEEKNFSCDEKCNDGTTFMHVAAHYNHLHVVRYLIDERKVSLNEKDSWGYTPLHHASFNGHLDVVRYLVDKKNVSFHEKDYKGRTPFQNAVDYGRVAVVKYYIDEKKMSIDEKDGSGKNVLDLAKERISTYGKGSRYSTPYIEIVNFLEQAHRTQSFARVAQSSIASNNGTVAIPPSLRSQPLTPVSTQFSSWANEPSDKNATFLSCFSMEDRGCLQTFKPEERQELHTQLNLLAQQQIELQKTIDGVARSQKADATFQQAIHVINQDPQTKIYFETLLRVMDQTLLASLVIGSGKVAQTSNLSSRMFEGATRIAGACFLPAAPFLSLANQVVIGLAEVSGFREMRKLAQWVRVSSDIPNLSLALALASTQAKQHTLKTNQLMNASGQSLLMSLKNKCQLLFEQVKLGEQFALNQERAILDAYELLSYMMTQDPQGNTQEQKIQQLVEHLTGQLIAPTETSSNNNVAIVTIASSTQLSCTYDIAALVVKMQALELKQQEAEMAAKLTQEQTDKIHRLELELVTQKAKAQELEKRLSEYNQRNDLLGNPRDNRQDGPQIQTQSDALKHPTLPQHVATSDLFATMWYQSQKHEATIGELVQATTGMQDHVQQTSQEQEKLYRQLERQKRENEQQAINEKTAANLRLAEFQASEYARKTQAKK